MRPPEFLLFQGDALRLPLRPKSVHCVVTSPPYYGLRSYDTAKWIGGDPACDHQAPIEGGKSGNKSQYQRHAGRFAGPACYRCGAQRIDRQIGLEESPSDYVAALVAAFAEVHRVLRDDGVLWVNIASSYNTATSGNKNGRSTNGLMRDGRPEKSRILGNKIAAANLQSVVNPKTVHPSLKPKDLIYIPAMLALELQKWGWYLRSDVIWGKENGMPSPVRDRPSMAHEYVFLLTKKSRYFYDPDAVAEPSVTPPHARGGILTPEITAGPMARGPDGINPQYADRDRVWGTEGTRNMRSVITLPTESFPGSHYAVMPSALASICIRAGTSQAGCCPKCSTPYRRVRKPSGQPWGPEVTGGYGELEETGFHRGQNTRRGVVGSSFANNPRHRPVKAISNDFAPGCKCDAGAPVPCVVFDPFGGVATSALVAVGLGRDGIACDLSAKYLKMGKRRIERPHAPPQRAPSPNRPEKPTPLFKDDDE